MTNQNLALPSWLAQREADVVLQGLPEWLGTLRQARWQAFLQRGLPQPNEERWQYADLSALSQHDFVPMAIVANEGLTTTLASPFPKEEEQIVFACANGHYVPAWSDLAGVPNNIILCTMREAWHRHAGLVQANWPKDPDVGQYPFACINAALFSDGLFLYVPDNVKLSVPIHLYASATHEVSCFTNLCHLIVLGKGSELVVVEEHRSAAVSHGPCLMNSVSHVVMGEEATFTHYKIQCDAPETIHLAHQFVHQQQASQFVSFSFSFGGRFSRDELSIKLGGASARCQTNGYYRLQHQNQYIDHHVDIHHAAPYTQSEMLYKGTIENRARAVFNGKLYVGTEAKRAKANQTNHHLMLAHDAEAYSKPELEIYNDDVLCRHGASTGQLDQDALFYLCARGIKKQAAKQMLLKGFAHDIIQRVPHQSLQMRLLEMV